MSVNTRICLLYKMVCVMCYWLLEVCVDFLLQNLYFLYTVFMLLFLPPLSNKNFTLIIYLSSCYYVASKISLCYLSLTIIFFSKEKQGNEAAIHLCFPPRISSMEQESSSHLDGNFLAFYVYDSL
jgi:hypothetical protein